MLKKRGKTWWTTFTRPDGDRIRRSLKTTDKSVAMILEREIVHKAAMESAGLSDPYEVHKKRPMASHLDDWQTSLIAKGNSSRYAREGVQRVRKLVRVCGFARWADIQASKVQEWLGEVRLEGSSAQTANHYLTLFKSFCYWMVHDREMSPESLKL